MPSSVGAASASNPRYREGEAMDGSKGGKAHKGRKKGCSKCSKDEPCQGCSQNDGKSCSSNKMDSISPQEYLRAVQLGIQNHGNSYIRARLDTEDAIRDDAPVGGKGKKCGNSYIPANAKCNAGAGAMSTPTTASKPRSRSIGNNTKLREPGTAGKILGAYGLVTGVANAVGAGQSLASGNYGTAVAQLGAAAGGVRTANLASQGRSGKALKNQIGTELLTIGTSVLGAGFDMSRKRDSSVWADGFEHMVGDGDNLAMDAVVKPKGKGQKCGNSYIPAGAKCNKGAGGPSTADKVKNRGTTTGKVLETVGKFTGSRTLTKAGRRVGETATRVSGEMKLREGKATKNRKLTNQGIREIEEARAAKAANRMGEFFEDLNSRNR